MRPRTCPTCLKAIGIDEGFHFDSLNNLICNYCNKPIVATCWSKEQEMEAGIRARQPVIPVWNERYTPPTGPADSGPDPISPHTRYPGYASMDGID